MTQKSVTKPSAAIEAKVVVFGVCNDDRPHAAWFPHTQAEPARAAAKQLRLNVIEVTNGTAADLIAKLPAGQIHAAGPAMVPPVREELSKRSSPPSIQGGKPGRNRGTRS
jgi:hypothetical protein